MIINSKKVKTEALLLICRDLINSYNTQDDNMFDISDEIKTFMNQRIEQLLKAINIAIQPIDYYTRNAKVSRISIILNTYQYINKSLSKEFQNGEKFNPSMLCFALLSTWFAELDVTIDDKEFIFFCVYPYSEIYDKLLLEVNNNEFKNLNISMLNIAEKSMFNLFKYKLK
ncbi:MAG: hypothetical protein U9Q20_02085 [Campylobacterota bacterium]|nr:hypothetical protein [Campylobacterota bacterium]